MRNVAWAGLVVGLLGVSIPSVQAGQVTAYSNVTTFSGYGYAGGGATSVSGDTITTMVADDITPVAGLAGDNVVSFTFSAGSFNSTTVSARPIVSIYEADNGGAPGTLLTTIVFNPIAFASDTVGLYTATSATGFFALPSGTFYAGLSFDNNSGATGATVAQLNNLGQGLFNPPTVGSSADSFFQAMSAGSIGTNDPSGSFYFFGGSPVANFGWAFTVATAAIVPEPSSVVLSGIAGLALTGVALRRRARTA